MSKIAPHEGKEVDLVLNGTKPFAVLEVAKDPGQILYALNFGDKLDLRSTGIRGEMSIELRGTGARVYHKYTTLVNSRKKMIKNFGLKDYQTRMGKIFGYSDEEIEEFINNPPDCSCGKCGG